MAATVMDLEIWVEGQAEPIQVRADQRDMAAFELEYKMGTSNALENAQMVFFRYIGWHAARRTGKILQDVGRDAWLDKVIGVEPVDDEEQEAGPTNPAA